MTGSMLAPANCTFTGYISYINLNITSLSYTGGGTLCSQGQPGLGAQLCDYGASAFS